MTAPVTQEEIKSARLITEEEWRELRRQSLYSIPTEITSDADLDMVDILLDHQKELLETTALNRVTICEKSRRTGATWALGADAVLTAGTDRAEGGMDVLYIGYNLDMAREFIDVCATWALAFNRAASEVQEFLFRDVDEHGNTNDIQAFRVYLASGFEIVALTSKPRSLRGRQGYLIIDEAAFHDDLKELMKAALAFLIWGGKVCVLSTHDGADNAFNELVDDVRSGRKNYGLVRFDFDDALHAGLYQRICLRNGEEWTVEKEAGWRAGIIDDYGEAADEELFCIASKGSGTFLPGALIRARMQLGIPVIRWEPPAGFVHWPEAARKSTVEEWCEEYLLPLLEALDPRLRHVFGMDFARVADLSVIWPLAIEHNLRCVTPFLVELRNVPYEQQKQILLYILKRLPRFGGGAMDATGNGGYLAEVAQQEFGPSLIEAVHFSVDWYRDNTPPFKKAFEDDEIVIPKDSDVQDDLRAFKMIRGVARIPDDQRTLERASKGRKRHGDAGIAALLAHFASEREVPEYGYEPVKISDPSDNAMRPPRDRDRVERRLDHNWRRGGL